MHKPFGPKPIARSGQLVIPKELLALTGLAPGNEVYLMAHDELDGAIVVIPAEMAVRWFEAGRKQAPKPQKRA
jgi:bifunctional DNA-binding transcriptional regulator/antitoxin component of YhaV-PrlF toxin-antitoxin module